MGQNTSTVFTRIVKLNQKYRIWTNKEIMLLSNRIQKTGAQFTIKNWMSWISSSKKLQDDIKNIAIFSSAFLTLNSLRRIEIKLLKILSIP